MKKIVALFLVIALAATFAFSASADTQSEIDRLIKALEDYQITLPNGSVVEFKATDINAAKNFLDAYDGEVTPAMVDAALDKLDEAAEIVKDAKVTDLSKLSESDRKELIEKADEAVEAFDLNVSLNNTSGKVEFKDDTGALKYDSAPALKKTGPVSSVYVVAGFVVIALVGCAVLTKKYALSK